MSEGSLVWVPATQLATPAVAAQDEVPVCHIPPGDPENVQILELPPATAEKHIVRHGDLPIDLAGESCDGRDNDFDREVDEGCVPCPCIDTWDNGAGAPPFSTFEFGCGAIVGGGSADALCGSDPSNPEVSVSWGVNVFSSTGDGTRDEIQCADASATGPADVVSFTSDIATQQFHACLALVQEECQPSP